MSVLKDSKNLVFGNGDLFVASTVGALPTVAQYKTARTNGTVGTLTGNVGAIKGNAELQIIRDLVAFEIGLPLEVADQTVSREGVMFKCSLAELSLVTIQLQLGLDAAYYSTVAAGAILVANQAITLTGTLLASLTNGPILYTTSSVPAFANPNVQNSGGGISATSVVPFIAFTNTGATETFTPINGNIGPGATPITIGGTVTVGDVLTIKLGNLYFVKYTVQTGDTLATIATGLLDAIKGIVHPGSASDPYVQQSFTATTNVAVLSIIQIAYLEGYDFIIDYLMSAVSRTPTGNIPSGQAGQISYYYSALASETLTGGGVADVASSSLAFFHPYKDGRVFQCILQKGNPTGTLTAPFDEITYSLGTFEMKGVADFTKPVGQHLYSIYREITA